MMLNLIDNAVNYNNQDGSVTVTAEAANGIVAKSASGSRAWLGFMK